MVMKVLGTEGGVHRHTLMKANEFWFRPLLYVDLEILK